MKGLSGRKNGPGGGLLAGAVLFRSEGRGRLFPGGFPDYLPAWFSDLFQKLLQGAEKILGRENADQLVVFVEYRESAVAVFAEDPHRFEDGVRGPYGLGVPGHDVGHRVGVVDLVVGRPVIQVFCPTGAPQVPVADDADQVFTLHHRDMSDPVCAHE